MKLQQLVIDLNQDGLTETFLAQKIGVSQATINRVKNGRTSEKHFDMAMRIVALHKQHFPDRHAG